MTFLTWFGAAAGNGPRVMIGETAHCARLYAAIVGASSRARKGTSKAPVRRIMDLAQAIVAHAGGIPPCATTAGPLSSGEGLIYAVRDPSENEGGELIDPGVEDKRLLVIEGEFGAAFKVMQREGNTLSTMLREAWDAANPWDELRPLTKRDRIKATNPHISIVGHITGAELLALLTATDLHNGLANRILWTCARRQKAVALPAPMNDEAVSELTKRLAGLLAQAHRRGVVSLAPTTAERWQQLYPTLTEDRSGAWGAATSRAEAQTMRLALNYALLDGDHLIKPVHLKAALAVWRYCDRSARYLFGDAETDPETNKVLLALAEGAKTQNELVNLFNRYLSRERLTAILEQLQESGRITCEQRKGGGRPATVWLLTPGFAQPGELRCEKSEISEVSC